MIGLEVYRYECRQYEKCVLIDAILDESTTLQESAKIILDLAYENKSEDNLTIQIVKVDSLAQNDTKEIDKELLLKPLPPILEAGALFDDYKIMREISASPRSHTYLCVDTQTNDSVVLKIPSTDLQHDKAYLERFSLEEWSAKRMSNNYLLKAYNQTREKNYFYSVSEYVEGTTLAQWSRDNPKVDLQTLRDIVTQIAKGLQAMHRQEVIHQDLRPQNIMINATNTIKIIDFGSVKVAGIADINTLIEQENILGTMMYTAPEYFLNEVGSNRSDIFSLGVIVYEMLSGEFPYGTEVSKATSRAKQRKLVYKSLYRDDLEIPLWVDAALKKALAPNPRERYSELSEFIYDLKHPNEALMKEHRVPFVERNPVLVWKGISFLLSVFIIYLLAK